MTKQEHELMLTLCAMQMQLFGTILELLKSRGIAELGDVEPFAALALENSRADIWKFREIYYAAAKVSGVELPEGFAPAG